MSSSRGPARLAVLAGALAVLAIPAAVGAAQTRSDIVLLRSLYAGVPAAFVLGLVALVASRRARSARARSIAPGPTGPVRLGRVLAWAGVYAGVTGGLALAVYAVLRWAQ
jgi:hypothetical protein